MRIDKDDIRQELALFRLEYPNSRKTSKQVIIDCARSRKYAHSWNGKFEHVPIELLLEPYVSSPIMAKLHEDYLSYEIMPTQMIEIEQQLSVLSKSEMKLIWLYYVYGYTHQQMADIYHCTRTNITKKINAIIKKVRLGNNA